MFSLAMKILLFFLFFSLVSNVSIALTGKEISNQVNEWLLKEANEVETQTQSKCAFLQIKLVFCYQNCSDLL